MSEVWGLQKVCLPPQHRTEDGSTSRSKTPHRPEWEEGEGRNVERIQKKNPRRRHSKGLKANTALQNGNVGEQESLRERENGKKSGMGGKGILEGLGWGISPPPVRAPRSPLVLNLAGDPRG